MAPPITKHASPLLLTRGVRGMAGQALNIVVHFPTAPVFAAAGFEFDNAFPSAALVAAANHMARVAAEHVEARLLVFGHADEAGGDAPNKKLSDRRAKALLAMLTQDLGMFDQVAQDDVWGVIQYQAIMSALGITPMPRDGKAGPQTTNGTKVFQGAYNAGRYHASGIRERAYGDLTIDGRLDAYTEAALRDAYLIEVGIQLEASRFTGPKFAGCSDFNRAGSGGRVALALYGADFPTASKIPCKEGDAGSCTINKLTKHPTKCNFYRRTLEAEQSPSPSP